MEDGRGFQNPCLVVHSHLHKGATAAGGGGGFNTFAPYRKVLSSVVGWAQSTN